jgi:hypothetical protein
MVENKDFQWNRPPLLLAQYKKNEGMLPKDILITIFNILHEEDLYRIVFHDNPDMDLLDFQNFLSHPTVSLQVMIITDDAGVPKIGGISWLSGLERFGDGQRAVGSFCAFKDYQNPEITEVMAKFVLEYWFECLGLDIVVGMTPSANSLAVRFVKRIGFVELCRIPKYSSLFGKRNDCVVTYMDKAIHDGLRR